MKPYDKSNSFMRRFMKRVSEYIPGMTWMNTLINDAQTDDDPTSTTENDDQPPVKKLCSSNNSFTNTKYQHTNSKDNHRSSNEDVLLPGISAVTCIPCTSKQSPKFRSQSSASLQNNDVGNRNKWENESHQQSSIQFHDTSINHVSSPSFKWDTFVNYGELSERQKSSAQKSPFNSSQVMYGCSSARSNLSNILGNTPRIHSEIKTTSSILLRHISSKNKEIEESTFIIQPKVQQRHKADQKNVPIKVESTVKIVETTPEKVDNKTSEISSNHSSRVDVNTTRKLRVNLSKMRLGIKSDELEMPAEINLPRISLPLIPLPRLNVSNTFVEDNEFTFNQSLTTEQYSSQIADKLVEKNIKLL